MLGSKTKQKFKTDLRAQKPSFKCGQFSRAKMTN